MSKQDQCPIEDPEGLMEFWKATCEVAKISQKKDDSTREYFKNKNGIIKNGEEITFYYGSENNDLNVAFLNEGVMKNIDGGWYVVDQYDMYHAYPDSFMIEYDSIRKLTKILKIKRKILKQFRKELLKLIKFLVKIY